MKNDHAKSTFVEDLKKELNLRSEAAMGRKTTDLGDLKDPKNELL